MTRAEARGALRRMTLLSGGIVTHCNVLYRSEVCCTILYCDPLYCAVVCCIVLYCTILECTVQFCMVLVFTLLHLTSHRFIFSGAITKDTFLSALDIDPENRGRDRDGDRGRGRLSREGREREDGRESSSSARYCTSVISYYIILQHSTINVMLYLIFHTSMLLILEGRGRVVAGMETEIERGMTVLS